MKIILFGVGLLLVLLSLFLSWVCKTDKKSVRFEADSFREKAAQARNLDDWAIYNIYATDAEAEVRGEGCFPLWIRLTALVLGIVLMIPKIISWF